MHFLTSLQGFPILPNTKQNFFATKEEWLMKKKLIALLAVLILLAGAMPAMAANPTDAEIVPDVLLMRPAGLAAIVLGSVIFVIALPVAIPSRSVSTAGRKLVLDPIEFTFIRPLGDTNYQLGTWPASSDSEK